MKNALTRFAIWSYNHSLPGLIASKISDREKVAYVVGANVSAIVTCALMTWQHHAEKELERKRNAIFAEMLARAEILETPKTFSGTGIFN